MRIPTQLTQSTVNISRQVTLTKGNTTVTILTGAPARITTKLVITPTPDGAFSQLITTVYLRPCDAQAGDLLTLPDTSTVEVRSATAVYGADGKNVAMVKVVAW
jgi:hypothetical protein